MSILIKGIDMPKEGLYNLSFAQSDGVTICLIEESYPDGGGRLVEHKGVVEVPTPHGRLIDVDEASDNIDDAANGREFIYKIVEKGLDATPTIIEAEVEE